MPYPGDKVVSLTLPSVVTGYGNGTNTISATSWTVLPTFTADATISNPSTTYNLLVLVSYGAWMSSTTNAVRACVGASGGINITPGVGSGGAVGQGEILYHGGTAVVTSHHTSFTCVITAGSSAVTFSWYAYLDTAGGTQQVNYPTTRIVPLQFI